MTLPLLLLAACVPFAGDGDRITAADLAVAEPSFAALPPETPLGYAPLPGARRLFGVIELDNLARRYGVSLALGRPLCVERAVAPVDPARLLDAMKDSLKLPDARIEIVE